MQTQREYFQWRERKMLQAMVPTSNYLSYIFFYRR